MAIIHFREDDITTCLRRTMEVSELYEMYVRGDGRATRRSVDDLLWLCEQHLQKKISIQYVSIPEDGTSIKAGFLALADGAYLIGLVEGMTDEDERFVLCKELFHVMFDHEGIRNIDLATHLAEYASLFQTPDCEGEPQCSVAWENLAEIAAMEFLFPYDQRLAHVNGGTTLDFGRLATRYGIPRYYVEIACSPGNMQFLGRVIDRIRKSMAA
ncbi:ImmA/IrrE family metallo-endopeptidase [Stenotrophomonas acidaminiphila]|uniref:ImmA/IrrE family metallo-endopeptidase n=1 Tax=Stenotrophomonas acidaminiphila TaxID=128780 RepID=UPI0028A7931D|nr:ImmA/IrrE family metallo-endopeptidase [Stenotrophomonas acidaminiphila]